MFVAMEVHSDVQYASFHVFSFWNLVNSLKNHQKCKKNMLVIGIGVLALARLVLYIPLVRFGCPGENPGAVAAVSPFGTFWLPWWEPWGSRRCISPWYVSAALVRTLGQSPLYLPLVRFGCPGENPGAVATELRDAASKSHLHPCTKFQPNPFSIFRGVASQTDTRTANNILVLSWWTQLHFALVVCIIGFLSWYDGDVLLSICLSVSSVNFVKLFATWQHLVVSGGLLCRLPIHFIYQC